MKIIKKVQKMEQGENKTFINCGFHLNCVVSFFQVRMRMESILYLFLQLTARGIRNFPRYSNVIRDSNS